LGLITLPDSNTSDSMVEGGSILHADLHHWENQDWGRLAGRL